MFRGSAVTAQEYISQQLLLGNNVSDKQALEFLTPNYDENGNYVSNIPQYEPETNFVALYNGTESCGGGGTSLFARQNRVVGVVSAQLRRRAPLIAGPSSSDSNTDPSSSTIIPSVPIPSPHVYVSNMKVDEKMQRRGVAMALLSFVKEYAESWNEQLGEEVPLVLSVDSDNTGAIRLYEKFGFEYLDQNDVFCTMILWL